MTPDAQWKITKPDLDVLRALAQRKAELARDPVNLERKRLWHALDAGAAERPMVLAESGVAFEDLPDARLVCEEEWARRLEHGLRFELFQFDRVQDDHVIEPYVQCNWRVNASDYGVSSVQHYAERVSGNVSSRCWDPPIKDLQKDLSRLRPRTFSVDRDASLAWKAHLEEVFDGILPVRFRGGFYWTIGMTGTAIDLIGLENMMTYMCTDPEGLHELMAFLQADMGAFLDWLEKENLFALNNENDYIGSGSMGYTRALPRPDWRPGDPARTQDLWVLCESQETVLVSPAQFHEFVFRYQRPLMERFGRVYYGCCEPVHNRWESLRHLPNLKRLSISPWCDQRVMAETLGRHYGFSRKSNPTLVSTPDFDEDLIRKDLRETLTAARDCNVELVMKDVHTLCGQPDRMARWVALVREVIEECAG